MRSTALVFLLIAVVAGLFSFGFVNGIHWAPAQVLCAVSLVLFILTAFAGFTPSVQTRPARKATATEGRRVPSLPWRFGTFALLYLSLGGLGFVWSGIWFWYLTNHPPENDVVWYWCYGVLLTSVGAIIIGLGLGRIFRAAQNVDLPPEETEEAQSEANALTQPASPAAIPSPGSGTGNLPQSPVRS